MDVLNTREQASLIWLAIIAIWLTTKKIDLWVMVAGLARVFFVPVIMRSIALMVVYIALCVWLLAQLDLWTLANLKTTILWSLTFALVLMMDVRRFSEDASRSLTGQLKELFGATILIQFLAEFYTFALWIELMLVPVASFLVLSPTVTKGKPEFAIVERFFGVLSALIGFIVLGHAVWQVIAHFRGFATADTAREFAVPLILSLLLAPFLYALNMRVMVDTTLRHLDRQIKDEKLRRYAALRGILAFGFNADLMRRWRRNLSLRDNGPETKEAVRLSIDRVKELRRRELYPPEVDIDDGWSPYEATRFLVEEGLVCGDWHPTWTETDWNASSPYFEIDGSGWKNNIAYYVDGTEHAATRLRLTLHINNPADKVATEAAHQKMGDCALQLAVRGLGAERAGEVMKKLIRKRPHKARANLAWLSLEEEETLGGRSEIRFAITHRAYVDPFAPTPPKRHRHRTSERSVHSAGM